MKRILFWTVVVAGIAAIVFLAARPQPLEVEVVRCARGTAEAFITEEAETRLDDDYVIAMPVNGRLLRIDLKEGAQVEKGSEIARLDTFERDEQLKRLEAREREIRALIVGVDEAKPKADDIKAAELAVQEAKLRHQSAKKSLEATQINYRQEEKLFKRRETLLAKGSIPEADFIEAERRYLMLKTKCDEALLNEGAARKLIEQAEVKLKRLRDSKDDNEFQRAAHQARIEQIAVDKAVVRDALKKSVIKAPVSGPVLEKYQESEQVLTAGTPLLKIGDLNSLRIESDILSEEVGRVKVGQPVEIFGPAMGEKSVTGKVVRIYPSGFEKISSLGIEQQRVKVIVAFDDGAPRLRPGVRLDIRIITDKSEDTLLIPERSLFKMSDQWHVFVVRDGMARRTPVKIGLRNDEHVEITSGLQAGDLVIPNPPQDLEDGAEVAATVGGD